MRALVVAPVLEKVKIKLAVPSSVTPVAGVTARVMRGSSFLIVPTTAMVVPML